MKNDESKRVVPRVYRRDEHTISRKNIDPDALKTMRRLMRHGYKAYLVGGSVRDLLLGKKPKDFDIATDATPRRIKALFRNCRIIGRRFKLAHIYFGNGKIFELSTFRAGQEADPEEDEKDLLITRDNIYGDEASDAFRRDITINGLFYALRSFSVIDYVGGMEDLRAGIVRVIGDPDVRFAEDPVRMTRVVRHAVRAGFRLEENCRESILRNHSLILNCSEVRLYEEVKKDLASGYALEILQQLSAHELLQHLIPELEDGEHSLLANRSPFSRCMNRVDATALEGGLNSVTPVLALIALFIKLPNPMESEAPHLLKEVEIGSFMQTCFKKLAVPRKERERITHILELWQYLMSTEVDDLNLRKLRKDASLPDVQMLFRFLNPDRQAGTLLDGLLEKQGSQDRHPGGKRRKVYRNPPSSRGQRRKINL